MMNENKRDFGALCNWGESMYGGWYVNMWAADGSRRWVCFHFNKFPEVRAWAKENGVKLSKDARLDN